MTRIAINPLIPAMTPWVPPVGAEITIENAIRFLGMRGVFSRDTDLQRRLFGYLRLPGAAPTVLRPYYMQCRLTLMSLFTLVVNGEQREVNVPIRFKLRIESFPGFSLPPPYTADAIVQRSQGSKRCAPNAVALVQVGSINRSLLSAGQAPTHTMIDIAEFWRHRASPERIQNQVFGLSWAESCEWLLKSFLQPGSLVEPSSLDQCECSLGKFGFGLISHFRVYDDLHDASDDTVHFAGVPRGDCVSLPREEGREPHIRL